MSKEHYVNPKVFDRLIVQGKLKRIGYLIDVGMEDRAQRVIDGIRDLNKLDPNFKYTCKCNKYETEWSFGYSDDNVYNMVSKKIDEIIIENCKIFDGIELDPENIHGGGIENGSACSCPFDL